MYSLMYIVMVYYYNNIIMCDNIIIIMTKDDIGSWSNFQTGHNHSCYMAMMFFVPLMSIMDCIFSGAALSERRSSENVVCLARSLWAATVEVYPSLLQAKRHFCPEDHALCM